MGQKMSAFRYVIKDSSLINSFSYWTEVGHLEISENLTQNCSENRSKSPESVWDNFVKTKDTEAKCNLCSQTIKIKGRFTVGLIRHLTKIHNIQFITKNNDVSNVLEFNLNSRQETKEDIEVLMGNSRRIMYSSQIRESRDSILQRNPTVHTCGYYRLKN